MKYYECDFGAIGAMATGSEHYVVAENIAESIDKILGEYRFSLTNRAYGGFGFTSRFEIHEVSEKWYNEGLEYKKRFITHITQ